jgi:dTMP kinase
MVLDGDGDMKGHSMKGKLITFEGPEGSGKSTHCKMLSSWLRKKGIPFICTREPGGTRVGELIRRILLDPGNYSIVDKCELLLYLAGRAQIVAEVIRPALSKGKIVISDRFSDATLAYQGYGNKLDINLIKKLDIFVTDDIRPDLTIVLDLNVKEGLRRNIKTKWPDRMEARTLSYHQRVRSGYHEIARKDPRRVKVVNVRENINETQEAIRKIVNYVIQADNRSGKSN